MGSGQVIKILIKTEVCKTNKRKTLARFTGRCSDTKGLTLFCSGHSNMSQRITKYTKYTLMYTPCIHITNSSVTVIQQATYLAVPS